MTKHINKIFLSAAIILLAFGANAKVTPLNEYKGFSNINDGGGDGELQCEAFANSYSPGNVSNADCTDYTIAGTKTKCKKNCSCDSSIYKFKAKDCDKTGFVAGSSGSCSYGGNVFYKTCDCASGYYPSDKFVSTLKDDFTLAAQTEATTSATHGSGSLTCYKLSGISCPTGTVSVSDKPTLSSGKGTIKRLNNFATYETKSPVKSPISGNYGVVCATKVTFSSPLNSGTAPSSQAKCAEYATGSDPVLSKSYWYYNGNCSSGSTCIGSANDGECYSYSYSTVSTYANTATAGSRKCYYATGCKYTSNTDGSICAGVTGTPTISTAYFNKSETTTGGANCQKVTGCATGYEKVYSGTTAPTATHLATTDSVKTYEVQELRAGDSSSGSYFVCRKHNGCDATTGYYNVACDGGCWDGWLSWWSGKCTSSGCN